MDWEITEKGIGREKTHFGITWASPRIPDVSGMLPDVSGMLPDVSGMSGTIKPVVPLWPRQTHLLPNHPVVAFLLT